MDFFTLIFYFCLKLQFQDLEKLFLRSAGKILCSNVRGLDWDLSDPTVVSSETLVSNMHHVLELLIPGFGRSVLCKGKMPQARGMAAYVRD